MTPDDIPKTPTDYSILTYTWVLVIAMWGGFVNYYRKLKSNKDDRIRLMELIGELFTSAFVGIITFWLCEQSGIPQLYSAALVGIASHMGSRAIYIAEQLVTDWIKKRWGERTE